jgi:hypothetical protein
VRERRQVAAGADRAAARHDGWTPAFSIAIERSSVESRIPEKPLASTFARSAIDARTARTGSGSPTPAAWLRSRFNWSAERVARDGGFGQRAEARVDAVHRRVARRLAHRPRARRVDARRRAGREPDARPPSAIAASWSSVSDDRRENECIKRGRPQVKVEYFTYEYRRPRRAVG